LNYVYDSKFGGGGEGLSENTGGEIMQIKTAFRPSTPAPLNFAFADYWHENKNTISFVLILKIIQATQVMEGTQ